ncbi:MAG: helix-turn-helix domain-containing protein [Alistipes senegalensis]|nr:helix-turn-helix domain-containing protein [Oxalobacter formigenes]MCM1280747.1 helix-turn-helix domain-containing protein [Alistipes senegalensis]
MTGQELKEALKALGWKQTDMARKMGLHRQTVCGWVADAPPSWAAEYIQAMLAISRLYDAFIKAPPRQRLQDPADDTPPDDSRAASMAARLQEFDFDAS